MNAKIPRSIAPEFGNRDLDLNREPSLRIARRSMNKLYTKETASACLKIIASTVLFERHPFERTVRWRIVANELFDDVGRAQMFPVFGGEVVRGQECIAIFDETLDGLLVFDAPSLGGGVESCSSAPFWSRPSRSPAATP